MSTDPEQHFIETMGLLSTTEGEPRIAGQVFGYLLVAGAPRTLQQMTEALGISKASASTNARYLEAKGMLRRVPRLGARQDGWEAISHPSEVMFHGLTERLRRNATLVREAADAFPEGPEGGAKARVDEFARFYGMVADFIEDWARHLGQQDTRQETRQETGKTEA